VTAEGRKPNSERGAVDWMNLPPLGTGRQLLV